MRFIRKYCFAVLLLGSTGTQCPATEGISVDVDLARQTACLLLDGKIVYESPICSGRPGHPTPTGDFTVLEKDLDHFSSLYGKFVDADGKVINWNADTDMPVPKGAKFVAAPMQYFLRFDGANGLHAGILPGYPASHGCVRLPKARAKLYFEIVDVGAPVHIHGSAPDTGPPARKPAMTPAPQSSPTPSDKRVKWFPFLQRLRD